MKSFEALLAGLFKEAEVIVPLYIHNEKSQQLAGLVIGTVDAILATVAQVQAAKAPAAPAA